jgi:hypothetical protein
MPYVIYESTGSSLWIPGSGECDRTPCVSPEGARGGACGLSGFGPKRDKLDGGNELSKQSFIKYTYMYSH